MTFVQNAALITTAKAFTYFDYSIVRLCGNGFPLHKLPASHDEGNLTKMGPRRVHSYPFSDKYACLF